MVFEMMACCVVNLALAAPPPAPPAKAPSKAAPAKKGKKTKGPPPPPPTSAEVVKVLDERQAEVGQCVVDGAEAGKAWTQVLKVKLTINSEGQVFALDLAMEPGNEKTEVTKGCIDKALRAGAWPKSPSPLVIAEREWTFKME